jgi:hypothetical protein
MDFALVAFRYFLMPEKSLRAMQLRKRSQQTDLVWTTATSSMCPESAGFPLLNRGFPAAPTCDANGRTCECFLSISEARPEQRNLRQLELWLLAGSRHHLCPTRKHRKQSKWATADKVTTMGLRGSIALVTNHTCRKRPEKLTSVLNLRG